jgi:hypothetical protein
MCNAKTEYVMARCLELMMEDEESNQLSNEIIEIEDQINNMISAKTLMLFSKLDELKEKQFSNCILKIYLAGFNDRIAPF